MKWRVILFFSILINYHCVSSQNDSTYFPVNIPEPIPYTVKKENLNINLPDSLICGNLFGYARLLLFINREGVLESFNIIQINLKSVEPKHSLTYFKYYSTPQLISVYPKNVLPYYYFFENKLNELPIVCIENNTPKSLNRLIITYKISSVKNE